MNSNQSQNYSKNFFSIGTGFLFLITIVELILGVVVYWRHSEQSILVALLVKGPTWTVAIVSLILPIISLILIPILSYFIIFKDGIGNIINKKTSINYLHIIAYVLIISCMIVAFVYISIGFSQWNNSISIPYI